MIPQVPEMSVRELQEAMASPAPPRLIDVREQEEWDHSRIPNAEFAPLSQWPQVAVEMLTDKGQPLVIQCHHGARSARATAWLISQGFTNVKNLAGGIDAWSTDVDPSVPRYH